MATHSSVLSWRIPGTEEPDRLPSLGSHRVGHDWSNLAAAAAMKLQRRQWHPTPLLLPGKPHGRRSLVGCSPWGRKESDTTEGLHFHFHFFSNMYFCPFVILYVEFFLNMSKVTSILHFCTLIYLLELLPPHDFQQTGSFILEMCFINT